MTNNSLPPRIAVWLLDLFVPGDQAPPILGDLLEEFSTVASRRGIGPARRWYWLQSAKTVPHLLTAQFRSAPWRILATVIAGVLLQWLTDALLLSGILYYPVHWPEPLRLLWMAAGDKASPLPFVAAIVAAISVGWIVASVSRRHEMAVTTALSLTIGTLRVFGFFHHWHFSVRPRSWSFVFVGGPGLPSVVLSVPIAILVGGLIARKIATASAKHNRLIC
jgi:hypothetical protein